MDPYSQHKKQTEYYQYLEKQRENYTDLTQGRENTNDSIMEFAKILFNKSKKNLDQDLTGILSDETMITADVFCMIVELVLYGVDILTDSKYNIFQLKESTDDLIYDLKSYLKSSGFTMEVHEEFFD